MGNADGEERIERKEYEIMALPININELLSQGENLTLELKLSAKGLPSSIWETYSAFANTNGGTIILGVQESQNRANRNERCVIAGVNNVPGLSLAVPSIMSPVVPSLVYACPSLSGAQLNKALTVLMALQEENKSFSALMETAGESNRTRFRKNIITPLLQAGFIAQHKPIHLIAPIDSMR